MDEKFCNQQQAASLIKQLGNDFAVVKNPDYIHPAFELYPLAQKITSPLDNLAGVVMDMDGTTTTTEELCIHSLEYMIRKMSGRMTKEEWPGLDQQADYPNIIGNSTTKHVEFLIKKYEKLFNDDAIRRAFIDASVWTLIEGKDRKRKEEVELNLINLNLKEILTDERLSVLKSEYDINGITGAHAAEYFYKKYAGLSGHFSFTDLVKIGIDIYYQRYHEILERIKKGEGGKISLELFGTADKHLIEPMPGVLVFLSLIKGWLGEQADKLAAELINAYNIKSDAGYSNAQTEEIKNNLKLLGKRFANAPLKVAIVTSSIYYEADIVMKEVFKVLYSEIDSLELSEDVKSFLKGKFSNYRNIYDAFVTASDSSEIRLKPHRDLYSIALHQLNIPKTNFNKVIGFEDSESGVTAIRAAGIGLSVAVPFAKTAGHNLDSAAFILNGGLPESLLHYNLFLKKQ